MLLFNSHRRFQERLSTYIDGELAEADALELESHLESCDSCAEEVAELRLVSAAIGELPDVAAPRSFALTPAHVAPPNPAPYAARSLNSGFRLTGGALAATLAVLLVLDAGGIVGDGGREGSNGGIEMRSEAPYDAGVGGADGTQAPESEATGGSGLSAGGIAASPPAPQVSPATQEQADDDKMARSSETASPAPPTPADPAELGLNGLAEEDTKTLTDAYRNEDSGDGLSTLRVTEIVLAALLGASIIGVVAATYAGRRRG